MLRTEKIAKAFAAICEEAEKLKGQKLPEIVQKGLSQIVSIAKHQRDIRGAKEGTGKHKEEESE